MWLPLFIYEIFEKLVNIT